METQVLITFVCCGEVGNVVCMDGICRFVDVAEIRGGPPIWTERERERHCVKERERGRI